MELLDGVAIIATVIGSAGWIVALFRFSSENKKDRAEATLSLQQANNLLFLQYQDMLSQRNSEIKALKDELARILKRLEDCENFSS